MSDTVVTRRILALATEPADAFHELEWIDRIGGDFISAMNRVQRDIDCGVLIVVREEEI
jgi:hypothetical protein